MSTSVPTAFIQLFESEVKAAYQREGSLLRGTIRTRTQAGAERIFFPKLGKGKATDKARHADVVPMDVSHTRAFVDPIDKYAPEYIDDLDQVKVNWSLRTEYARASAWALGRETDDQIITAAQATTNITSAGTVNGGGDLTLTLAVVNKISERLNNRDVPMDRRRFAVISPETLSELLTITGATSSDFTNQQLLITGSEPAFWMGFNWLVHTGLPSGTKGLFWHFPSMGHAIAKDITTAVDWVPEKVAWLVNSWMSMNAVIIDEDGVEELTP